MVSTLQLQIEESLGAQRFVASRLSAFAAAN
jgi:hypothetical protein